MHLPPPEWGSANVLSCFVCSTLKRPAIRKVENGSKTVLPLVRTLKSDYFRAFAVSALNRLLALMLPVFIL
jgi:hypothetical protein